MLNKWISILLVFCMAAGFCGCSAKTDQTEIQVFVAASLHSVMKEFANEYQELHPDTKIVINADSSGKLMTQIQEGYECDIFFSAAATQMDLLEEEGFLLEGTRKNLIQNQLVLVARKDSDTKVTGLENIGQADNIALAGGSVPAGYYTRQAFVNLGLLSTTKCISEISTAEIRDALGGVEISEQDNVSKVLISVVEGICEVGTTYYSDLCGYEDQIEILEKIDQDLTGEVVYPVCRIHNKEADEMQQNAAKDFYDYITSEESRSMYETYGFCVNED